MTITEFLDTYEVLLPTQVQENFRNDFIELIEKMSKDQCDNCDVLYNVNIIKEK